MERLWVLCLLVILELSAYGNNQRLNFYDRLVRETETVSENFTYFSIPAGVSHITLYHSDKRVRNFTFVDGIMQAININFVDVIS